MRSPRSVASQIAAVEGFEVRFVAPDGDESDRRRVADYPYERAAQSTWTAARWRSHRIESNYPDFTVEAVDPAGNVVHGKTLLSNLRRQWAESWAEDEFDQVATEAAGDDVTEAESTPSVPLRAKSGGRTSAKGKSLKTLEQTLWDAADKMRGNLEASEYKHVFLGLIFLKYVSDAFEERREYLVEATADPTSDYFIHSSDRRASIVESRDEYTSQNVFWIGANARWSYLQERAKQPDIGVLIDSAMDLIEKDNPSLRGVLPKTYARADIDKRLLGELVDLIGTIGFTRVDHGADDVLGRVYEYCLGKFAASEGRNAGEFYTPRSVVRLLVEMLEPYRGRVFDPCCGSGGMFVQSSEFVAAHGGSRADLSIYGQEFVGTTWRLAKMNLAIRGIDANLGDRADDSFHRDMFPDLRADFILANPPFNKDDWYSDALRDDARWRYGLPPTGNANFAWVQHFVYHLAPSGIAGFVLANGSLSSKTGSEGEIRRKLVEEDLVDCIVAMPGQLFFNTPIPVCLWFVAKARSGGSNRDRRGEVLFIDASAIGTMQHRTLRVFTDGDVSRIADTYHAWRDAAPRREYEDVLGYCYSASFEDIAKRDFVLVPGRYVGSAEAEIDSEPVGEKLDRLRSELYEEFEENRKLEHMIRDRLKGLIRAE